MDIVAELKKCLIFSGLSDDDLIKIAQGASLKEYPKKSLIFSEGDEATGFYILVSGMVKIYRISPDSREQILHIINPRETFAEAAIFIGKSYPAFAETILDSKVIYFEKKRFLKTLEENPKVSLNLIISLSLLLKKMVDLVDNVSLKTVDVRLAEFLLEEGVKKGRKVNNEIVLNLDITKTELAKKIGTVNETLSRALKRLKENGHIDVDKKVITIKSIEGLQRIKEETRSRYGF
ncbi:MAG: Crp/Fnr family transcriptional regulator [bacterium]